MPAQPFEMQTLTTPRLLVRRFRPDDLDGVHRFQGDADVVRYLPWEVRTRAESQEWLEERCAEHGLSEDEDVVAYAVERRSDSRLIGSLTLFLRSVEQQVAEVGFVLEASAQGQGYAHEATAVLLDAVFDDLGARTAVARLDARNEPSARLLERLGMSEEPADPGLRRFALTREQWRARRGDAPLVVLLPSPLLGPSVWAPVGDRLSAAGREVLLPELPELRRTPDDVLAALLSALPVDRDLLLVPHSGAGAYVATLAAARRVVGVVFVDAVLPSLDGPTPTAPPGALDHLTGLAGDDGLLPGWTSWWPEAEVAGLFPDAGARARVEAEQPRLPLSYFRTAVPSPSGWDLLPCGYLAFGRTYAGELARAEAQGWPVVVLDGGHLHQLVDPAQVATELDGLLRLVRRG